MAKQPKRVAAWTGDRDAIHALPEAIKLVKANATAKFDESIEIAVNLGVDPRHADQNVRGVVSLPSGTGPTGTVNANQLTPGGNFIDPANYTDYLGNLHRTQIVLFVNQEITPWLSLAYEGFYNHRLTVSRGYTSNAANITLNPGTPYYINNAPGVPAGTAETKR